MKEDCAKCILGKSVMYGLIHPREYYNPYTDCHNQSQQWWIDAKRVKPKPYMEVITLDKLGSIHFACIVKDVENEVNYDGWNIPHVRFWLPFYPTKEMAEYYELDY